MPHKYRVFLICSIGIFITVFDNTSSIVALPTIALEFGTDLPTTQWVIIGNTLMIAALLVPMGRLSDIIGRKRIYVLGCFIFATGALFAWLSNSIIALIASRGLVGIGSAMTQGTAMAILVGNFDVSERAKMLGLQMAAVGFGAMAGPAIGGLIVGAIGWRVLFALTAVFMAAVCVAGQRTLRRRPKRPAVDKSPFDTLGAVAFSSCLIAGLLTLTLGPRVGWTEPGTIAGAGTFLLLVALFIVAERRHPTPMLDLRLLRNPAFAFGSLSALVLFMGISSTRFLAPFFLQGVKGFDPSTVGLLMLPSAVITAIAAPPAGRLADRFGVRLVANIGFGIAGIGLLFFASLQASTAVWVVVIGLVVMACGMSSFTAPNSAAILNAVSSDSHGLAASVANLCRNTGNVIGIAFGTAIVTLTMSSAGYAPSLSEVNNAVDQGIYLAFADGFRTASFALLFLLLPVLTIVTLWSVRSHQRRDVREPGSEN